MNYFLFFMFFINIVVILTILYILLISINKKKYKFQKKIFENEIVIKNLHKEIMIQKNSRDFMEKDLSYNKQEILCVKNKLSIAEDRVCLLDTLKQEYDVLKMELNNEKNKNYILEFKLKELSLKTEEIKSFYEKKIQNLLSTEKHLLEKCKILVNDIFDSNYKKNYEITCNEFSKLLYPLESKLNEFHKRIQDNFQKDNQDRCILVYEIKKLHELNQKMSQEAVNLTNALKGNKKILGNWGEMILIKVLETAGLREGHEYNIQKRKNSNIKEDNIRLQPDVIVSLPKNRKVIIDSKISLIAYERYFNSDNDIISQLALSDHIHSLRTHIKLLGGKDYNKILGFNVLDYILMFIPIETAFILAINKNPELITEALSYNIILVSPSTLLVALRTINNLWRYEYQNRNVQDIANRATLLYDKLRLFIGDLDLIGQSLDKAQNFYYSAKNKLSEGRGNLISQAEKFRILGVNIKKPIGSSEDKD